MDTQRKFEKSDIRTKEGLKEQIAFTKKEKKKEIEIVLLLSLGALFSIAIAICLLTIGRSLELDMFIWVIGLLAFFLIAGFCLYLAGTHFYKIKSKAVLIKKLEEESEQ